MDLDVNQLAGCAREYSDANDYVQSKVRFCDLKFPFNFLSSSRSDSTKAAVSILAVFAVYLTMIAKFLEMLR
jgi:hypothetical protein